MSDTVIASKTADLAGGALTYLERGSGTPIVLLHGVGSAARSWRAQLERLSDRFRVVAWDAPGYGGSATLPAAKPDASDYAVRLHQLVDALGLERFHLVGHSLGAIMAARYAAEHPDRLLSLTLASPSTGHARLAPAERDRLRNARLDDLEKLGPEGMARARGPRLVGPNASDAARQSVIDTMSLIRPDGYRAAVWLLSGADTQADVARLPAELPVQFVIARRDVVTPPEGTLGLAAARPGARIEYVDDAGHALYIERPDEFDACLVRFVLEAAAV